MVTKPIAWTLFTVTAIVIGSSPTRAQDLDTCHAVSPTERVVVTTDTGSRLRGTLLCMNDKEIVLAGGVGTAHYALDSVRRIATRADSPWDGAARGAAVPLILFAVFCRGECPAEAVGRTVLAYGLVGLTLDALRTERRTIYAAGSTAMRPASAGQGRLPGATLSWRVRF